MRIQHTASDIKNLRYGLRAHASDDDDEDRHRHRHRHRHRRRHTLQAVAYAHCRDSEDIDTDSLGGSRQHGIALCTRHIGVRMGCDIEYCVELDWIGLDWIGWGEHMHRLG